MNDNDWLAKRFDHRWVLSALFGLVHGWTMSGAPREGLLALLGFNAGLGLGQLSILLGLVPVIALARRRPWFSSRVAGPLSFGAAAFGVVCVAAR